MFKKLYKWIKRRVRGRNEVAEPSSSFESFTTTLSSSSTSWSESNSDDVNIKQRAQALGFLERDLLGQGAYGRVYKKLLTKDKAVAVKFFPPANIESFYKEARIHSMLRHPNIVTFLYFSRVNLTITTTYVEGETLKQCLDVNKSGLSWEKQGIKYTYDLLSALSYLKLMRVIHNDLHAHNVMINGTQAKLIDFGLAERLQYGETHFYDQAWPHSLLAPERQKPTTLISYPSDVYSLGVLLHYMLTNRRPPKYELDAAESLADEPFHYFLAFTQPEPEQRPTPEAALEALKPRCIELGFSI